MDGEDMVAEDVSAHSKEVARGSFWSLFGGLFYKFISFLYVVIIARMASQDDIGLFYLSLAVVTTFIVISDLGLPASLIRYTPYYEGRGEHGKVRALLKYAYLTVTLLSVLFVGAIWLCADTLGSMYQNPLLPGALRIVSLFLLLNNIFRINYSFLNGLSDIKQMQFLLNMDNLLKFVLTIAFFFFFGASFMTIAMPFLITHLLVVLVGFLLVSRKERSLPVGKEAMPSFHFVLTEVVPFGLMLTAIYSLNLLLVSSDRILLGYLAPPSQATQLIAVYSISTTLATVLVMFPAAIGSVFLPVMSRLAGKDDTDQMRSTMDTAQRWLLFIILPVTVVMISLPSELLGAFYGQAYQAGWLVMFIFTLGIMMNGFAYLVSMALAALRQVGLELRISAAAAVANVILCILLIPGFGMEGAALASLLSFTLLLLLYRHYGRVLYGFKFPAETLKLLAAAAAAFIVMALLKAHAFSALGIFWQPSDSVQFSIADKAVYLSFLALLAAFVAGVFFLLALLMKCLRREDVSLLGKILRRAMVPPPLAALALRIASYGVAAPK
ncbi:MAG: flippase [Candidatus ainarchaeum sp.]|nr:flippase [Candidatus ainarchaeum sp.]